jgi:hypothetical protein
VGGATTTPRRRPTTTPRRRPTTAMQEVNNNQEIVKK